MLRNSCNCTTYVLLHAGYALAVLCRSKIYILLFENIEQEIIDYFLLTKQIKAKFIF
jgi:hydrogenase maturation factor